MTPPAQASFRGDPALLLGILVAAFALTQAWSFGGQLACIDYYQYWVVGQAVRHDEAGNVFSAESRARLGALYLERAEEHAARTGAATRRVQAARERRVLETYSTPWLYTLVGAASSGDYDRDESRFQKASLAALVAAIVLLCRRLRYGVAATLLALLAFLWWFRPTLSDMYVGNTNRLQLALLALFVWLSSRPFSQRSRFLSGCVMGAGLAFKPNLVYVAAVVGLGRILLDRARGLLAETLGMAAGVTVAVLLSGAYFGSLGPWVQWARELPDLLEHYDHSLANGNYALSRVLHETAGVDPSPAVPVACAAVVAWALLRRAGWFAAGRRGGGASAAARDAVEPRERASVDSALVGLGACVAVLSSRLAWLHYFLLTVPAALYLLRPVVDERPRAAASGRRGTATRGLTLLAVSMVAHESWLIVLGQPQNIRWAAFLVSGGTVLLFVLAAREITGGAPRDREPSDSGGRGSAAA